MRYTSTPVKTGGIADEFVFDLGPVAGGFQPRQSASDELKSPDGGGDGWPGGRVPQDEIWGDGRDDYIDHHDHTEDEVIYTFAGDDVVILGTGDNEVFAGIGNDEVYGNSGEDLIVGGDGNDIIFGGGSDDEIHAGDGLDIVSGGAGDDFVFLTKDGQLDRILFNVGDDNDVVDGFETDHDIVEISGGLAFGDLTFTYNGDGSQALVEIGNSGDTIIFTGLDGNVLDAGNFDFV